MLQNLSILFGNGLEEEAWFHSSYKNVIPWFFQETVRTHEKVNKLTLQSPLTVFFWCTGNVNLEVRHSSPFRKNAKLLLTHLRADWNDCLRRSKIFIIKKRWEDNSKTATHVAQSPQNLSKWQGFAQIITRSSQY
jgi:hypothetical protein